MTRLLDTPPARWTDRSALFGAILWVVIAAISSSGASFYRWIELFVLLAALVVMPLGLGILRYEDALWSSRPLALATWLQPFTACVLATAFLPRPGLLAAGLTLPWVATCGLISAAGALSVLQRRPEDAIAWGRTAAMLFVFGGASSVLLSRAGISPLGFVEPIVLLTGIHFHYTAFAAPVMGVALARFPQLAEGIWRRLHRTALLVLVIATPTLAMGWIVHSPTLKLIAVSCLTLSVGTLAGAMLRCSGSVSEAGVRALLMIAAGSVLAGMALALTYALAEHQATDWITIPRMVRTHGWLNGLGFSVAGLLALRWSVGERSGR